MTNTHSNSPQRVSPSKPGFDLYLDLSASLDASQLLLEDLKQQDVALPGFERLLARGRWLSPGDLFDAMPPAGPMAMLGDGKDPKDAFVLCADPVHLRPDQDFLLLFDATTLALSLPESRALADTFNEHFREDGLELWVAAEDRWYLQASEPMDFQTNSTQQLSGRNIGHFMPRGPDGTRIEQMMNEVQMLFHDHPVNQDRQARGMSPVSGIWLWGGGMFAEGTGWVTHGMPALFANSPFYRGLGECLGIPAQSCPESFGAWKKLSDGEASFVLLNQASEAARQGDAPAWQVALTSLDRDWLEPASRSNQSLLLNLGAFGRIAWQPSMAWRLWRRRRSLAPQLIAQLGDEAKA